MVVLKNKSWGEIVLFVCFVAALFPLNFSQAKTVTKPVANYPIDCGETFSCPDSIKPRVAFWVEVFSRWDTNTAIFHDKENPHRVYSTIKRKEGCRRSRKGDSIDRERKRLKRTLKSTAKAIVAKKTLSKSQQNLEKLFIGQPVSEITKAADRIRCQSGNQDRMAEALQHFRLYRPTILDALEQENLTPELQYLPFVESAFNPNALSHVGAAGMWQIMPSTGRKLGLIVNSRVDERYDPYRATYAAARYFRDSVDKLTETAIENGNTVEAKHLNPFVITSYNYGVHGMQRAVALVGLDYERLLAEYKSPNFQTAVKNFYASFLAARHVAKNRDQFFPNLTEIQGTANHANIQLKLPRATSVKRLSQQLNLPINRIKKLNPALKSTVWKHKSLIPSNYTLKLPHRAIGWDAQIAAMQSLPAEYEKSGYTWHRVKRGQTACVIAEKYRASCRALFKLNKLNKKGTIYAGQRLKVPTRSGGIAVKSSPKKQSKASTVASSGGWKLNQADQTYKQGTKYRVKSGDTACEIAENHGLRCREFLAINGLTRGSTLRVGQKVSVAGKQSLHTVKRGQTACSIAESYRVSCNALLTANRLNRKSKIYVGQRLRIPAKS